MADTAIERTITYEEPSGIRGPQNPALVAGTYVANDTDYHAMYFNTGGKRFMTYCVDNPSDKDVVVTIYGAPYISSVVGDAGVFLIGTYITAAAGDYKEDTTDEGALYYIVRCKSAAVPDGSTITVHAHLMA